MSDDNVLEFNRELDNLLKGMGNPAAPLSAEPAPATAGGAPAAPADMEPAEVIELDRQELAKKSDPLPETPQERYRPHAGYLNRLQADQRTFYCVFADCTFQGFPYAHYDGIRFERAEAPGGGLELVVRFSGSVVEEARIAGHDLRFVARCIGLGIMPWVWELPPGQKAGGGTVITRITISRVER